MKISSRLPDVGTTIFTVMSKMAHDQGAINLSQGFPDFPIDEKLIHLVSKYMLKGHNQYAPMAGAPALLNAVAKMVAGAYGRNPDPEREITVTAGATEAIFAAIAAFITNGDEVILFDPSYDSYNPAIRLNGGIPVHIKTSPPTFAIPWDEVKSKITPRTRMIMVNTPHNPTGTVLSEGDLKTLQEIALTHDLIIISDEVYDKIVFDGHVHQSVLRFPELADRSVAICSFGKTFHATGWKVGYAIAPERLTQEIRKTHQFITFSVNTPVQLALAEYLETTDSVNMLGTFFQQKRDLFLDSIKGSSFEPLSSSGSYFQLLSFRHFSKEDEVTMAEELTKRFKVASIPISVFYQDRSNHHLLRFCFAKKDETLAQAGEILRKI